MSKKGIWKYARVCLMAAVCVLFLCMGMKAEAAEPAKVTGVEQTKGGSNNVTVKWSAVTGDNIQYKVELSTDKRFSSGNTRTENPYGTPERYISGLSTGTKYYVRVRAYDKDAPASPGEWSDTLEVVTAPAKNDNAKLTQTGSKATSITLKWTKNPEANAYRIEYYKSGNSSVKKTLDLGNVSSCTIKKLAKNSEYSFYVYPVLKSASGHRAVGYQDTYIYGCPTLPGKVSGFAAEFFSPTSLYLDLTWNKRASADGYQYEIWTMAKKSKKLVSGKTNSNTGSAFFSNNKFKNAQFVKIRLRPYVKLNNGSTKYGAWTGWKYTSKQPSVSIQNVKGGQKLSWKKVTNADSYTVWVSTNKNTGYKKVATTKKTSLTVKKCGKSALKDRKWYYYTIVANKKIGKKTYQGSKTHYFSLIYYKK